MDLSNVKESSFQAKQDIICGLGENHLADQLVNEANYVGKKLSTNIGIGK